MDRIGCMIQKESKNRSVNISPYEQVFVVRCPYDRHMCLFLQKPETKTNLLMFPANSSIVNSCCAFHSSLLLEFNLSLFYSKGGKVLLRIIVAAQRIENGPVDDVEEQEE